MAMSEYYLRIDRFTQNRFTGDPEVDVNPDRIDREKESARVLDRQHQTRIDPSRSSPFLNRRRHQLSPPPAEPENPATLSRRRRICCSTEL